ncbi:hypothetical protein [Pseudoroseicyclus sp. CXY001]|uniref:hypothetical protein n=1 Tax=Pseudoroseicyclus sp. CXY001 TaxID=3242492 RepID=UPI0035717246
MLNMPVAPQNRSKVAQFLYHRREALEFRPLAEALLTVLERQAGCAAETEFGARHAVFVLPELTVSLSYAPSIVGPWQSALTLWLDGAECPSPAAPHLGSIRGLMISAVNAGNTPDRVIRHEVQGPATEELIAQLQAALTTAAAPPPVNGAVPIRPASATPRRRDGDDSGPGTPGARAPMPPANREPEMEENSLQTADQLRRALYADEDTEAEDAPPSKVLRLAAHTINASVMVIALPVGASLMVYSCLRGENLTLSARAMAITGITVGLMRMAPDLAVVGF